MFRNCLRNFITTLLFLCLFAVSSLAAEVSCDGTVTRTGGISDPGRLFDGNRSTYSTVSTDGSVTLSRADGIAALYIEFDRLPQSWICLLYTSPSPRD